MEESRRSPDVAQSNALADGRKQKNPRPRVHRALFAFLSHVLKIDHLAQNPGVTSRPPDAINATQERSSRRRCKIQRREPFTLNLRDSGEAHTKNALGERMRELGRSPRCVRVLVCAFLKVCAPPQSFWLELFCTFCFLFSAERTLSRLRAQLFDEQDFYFFAQALFS